MPARGRPARRKGANGERELLAMLRERLSDERIARNLAQVRDAGDDATGLERYGVSLEIKRQEQRAIGVWWAQAERQADAVRLRPALAYRRSREPWTVLVALSVDEFAALLLAEVLR